MRRLLIALAVVLVPSFAMAHGHGGGGGGHMGGGWGGRGGLAIAGGARMGACFRERTCNTSMVAPGSGFRGKVPNAHVHWVTSDLIENRRL